MSLKEFFTHKKNRHIRVAFTLLFLLPGLFIGEFISHFYVYLTGSVIPDVITHQWHIVALNIIVFVVFLIPLSYRRKADWKDYGLATGFFISLFVEMYGIPFSILFAARLFNITSDVRPEPILGHDILGVWIGMDLPMAYGALLMIIGAFIILYSWVTLYRAIQNNDLVTTGIYAYSRHPQYFGFILILIGWIIGWPSMLTLLLAPILIYKYVGVCFAEEKELEEDTDYIAYKEKVPFFV